MYGLGCALYGKEKIEFLMAKDHKFSMYVGVVCNMNKDDNQEQNMVHAKDPKNSKTNI